MLSGMFNFISKHLYSEDVKRVTIFPLVYSSIVFDSILILGSASKISTPPESTRESISGIFNSGLLNYISRVPTPG